MDRATAASVRSIWRDPADTPDGEAGRLARSSREELIEYLAQSAGRVRTLEEKLRGAELENRYLFYHNQVRGTGLQTPSA